MDFFGIGFGEILLILVVILIVMGPGKVPEIARTIGKTLRALKKASSDLTSQVTKELEEEEKRLSQSTSGIADTFKQPLDEPSNMAAKPGDGEHQPPEK